MSRTITTSAVDSLPVIGFYNRATKSHHVFICESMSVMRSELKRLRAMDHIKISMSGHGIVKRENGE